MAMFTDPRVASTVDYPLLAVLLPDAAKASNADDVAGSTEILAPVDEFSRTLEDELPVMLRSRALGASEAQLLWVDEPVEKKGFVSCRVAVARKMDA